MITDGIKLCYLEVWKLSTLLWEITSNNNGDFYFINYLRSFKTENSFYSLCSLLSIYNVFKNHDYCYAEIPKEGNEILKYNHGEKSMKVPFIIYVDLESLLKKSERLP